MKRISTAIACALALTAGSAAIAAPETCMQLLDHAVTPLGGKPVRLCDAYPGKALLIVNTASFCGFTPQYKGLEALYEKYRDRGLVVLGFPSNDFGRQEPGSAKEIKEFCERKYKVQFPLFEKAVVSGPGALPLYADLTRATGEAPQWNFHKYLIDAHGTRVESFDSAVTPEDKRLAAAIEKALP